MGRKIIRNASSTIKDGLELNGSGLGSYLNGRRSFGSLFVRFHEEAVFRMSELKYVD